MTALHLVPVGAARPGEAARPLHALARISFGPVPLDFHRLAAEFPAVHSGLALAGDADLEVRLACTGPAELRAVAAALQRSGAARVRIELVLRSLDPGPPPIRPVS
ncbi:hypothetical protein RMN57_32105 [Kitasatospora sp. CM 4170]|uniref:Uncharacterized protein n=1 Tax=Kitasatospora aburaviensis TaxID=67265 RepID=A0ABW1F1A8_9ACTN|nr:hypothetical protein [Kitasatospora sp. CM 4170]WNM49008.1 hypothetical protein RMN57_32105 [Kitasatospora sp. CM 4170]